MRKVEPIFYLELIWVAVIAIGAITWVVNDPMSKVYSFNLFGNSQNSGMVIITCVLLFLVLLIKRISNYSPLTRDRLFAVFMIAFIHAFWAAFEQAGGNMTIFAKDHMNRTLKGNGVLFFKILIPP